LRFADDHLERRSGSRSPRVNCSRLALSRRFVVAAAVSAATIRVFRGRSVFKFVSASRRNQHASGVRSPEAVIFQFFGIDE
jgi:hypothetical protein